MQSYNIKTKPILKQFDVEYLDSLNKYYVLFAVDKAAMLPSSAKNIMSF